MKHTWLGKTWIEEDRLYVPKRRVDNKISWQRPHIIGEFFSNKMNRRVEYHSLNECLFYYLLELDRQVIRYYVQPIEVEIPVLEIKPRRKKWIHVPDCLVFREGSRPMLFQIKESPNELSNSFLRCNHRCELLANQNGWEYAVVYPKQIPQIVLSNVQTLSGYLKPRKGVDFWKEQIALKVKFAENTTIDALAESFAVNIHPLIIKPFIYHMVATGAFSFNIFEPLSSDLTPIL